MDAIEVMVMISNPDDFISWNAQRKVERYKRVIDWHDYITRLHETGKVRQVWGSHQLLSRAKFVTSLGLLVAVYQVESWREFDELLLNDPLRDISQYVTTPLTPLFEDREADLQRYEQHKQKLLGGKDDMGRLIYSAYRSLYNQPPDYFGKYDYIQPQNLPTDINVVEQPGDPLQILIMGVNPDEYITLWDDTHKLIHHEKVTWWHDYTAMLIHQDKISHAWGTHDFCYLSGMSAVSASAVVVYKPRNYDEFDTLYRLDPIRDTTQFWSILLQPIADQRRMDEERLKRANP